MQTTATLWDSIVSSEASHIRTGRKGERVAAKFLRKLGYKIQSRNVRLGKDEIDIIAVDPEGDVLVFAEVKTRSRKDEDYHPGLNADWHKLEKLRRSARRWVGENGYEGSYRIDLVCVAEGTVIEHVKELSWD